MPVAAILTVSADDVGYQWFSKNGKVRHTAALRWADVSSVEVFKRDLITYDLICIQVRTPKEEEPVEFDEEDPNWKQLMAALPVRLPGCKPRNHWYSEVAFPAFETKLKRVYEKTETTLLG